METKFYKPLFPQYRKLNDGCYFKIIDKTAFEELKIMGKKYMFSTIRIVQFSERIYIEDVLKTAIAIDEKDFVNQLAICRRDLKEMIF